MTERIEDGFEDVLGKAASGLGLDLLQLSERTGISIEDLNALMEGKFDEEACLLVSRELHLDGPSVVQLAKGTWRPEPVDLKGLTGYTTPFPVPGYEEMTVNSFLVLDSESKSGAVFDPGADVSALLADIQRLDIKIERIFLTHSHDDHIHALSELLEKTGNPPVWIHENEPLSGLNHFCEGRIFRVGGLEIESRLTNGHSPGGTTFVVSGLSKPVAIVGDSLFCCSQGGAPNAYERALENNRKKILSLPDETILCPGHGPATTVGEEKQNNPFFRRSDS
ncbi:MBL fold metallo-hydrolase [Puniceicoccales bacterium CK1056]|uniref:MBL fold metallo-hydrolase n=1 Tax=Oceanipulchritudo coccoides TaxID=2706888 RepID=A0A6B2M365_9BACT|nr:MBL fold metallo-hydrolase [Oceanipulchritudo coccoides]NDV63451.1 MBL fold metallo-hydrolase [Oceanipulchritudo coccoides]